MDTNTSSLGLPSAIRLRIYRRTNPQLDLANDLNPLPCYTTIRSYGRTYNLMLTSRTIYTEASPMLYPGNHLSIRYRDHGNLAALRNLLPSSVASIHHLTNHLNVGSCEQGYLCCKGHRSVIMHDCAEKHDQPLGPASPGCQTLLSKWIHTHPTIPIAPVVGL